MIRRSARDDDGGGLPWACPATPGRTRGLRYRRCRRRVRRRETTTTTTPLPLSRLRCRRRHFWQPVPGLSSGEGGKSVRRLRRQFGTTTTTASAGPPARCYWCRPFRAGGRHRRCCHYAPGGCGRRTVRRPARGRDNEDWAGQTSVSGGFSGLCVMAVWASYSSSHNGAVGGPFGCALLIMMNRFQISFGAPLLYQQLFDGGQALLPLPGW